MGVEAAGASRSPRTIIDNGRVVAIGTNASLALAGYHPCQQQLAGARGSGASRSIGDPGGRYIYQGALLCADCAVITMNEFELFNMLGGSSSPFRRPKPRTDSDSYP